MATTENAGQSKVEIRKYPNRRYYDTACSSYVTLQQIRELIRQGADVRVVDSKSEEDITPRVLAQIILEYDAAKLQIFPLDLLHDLIRANDTLIRGLAESFFDHALFMFIESQRLFDRYMRLCAGMTPDGPLRTKAERVPAKQGAAAAPAESPVREEGEPESGEPSDKADEGAERSGGAVAVFPESEEPDSARSPAVA
jgi:polyhydroxyalkanoate synthesis repressor PhaR